LIFVVSVLFENESCKDEKVGQGVGDWMGE